VASQLVAFGAVLSSTELVSYSTDTLGYGKVRIRAGSAFTPYSFQILFVPEEWRLL
jgi:hypothetical protein